MACSLGSEYAGVSTQSPEQAHGATVRRAAEATAGAHSCRSAVRCCPPGRRCALGSTGPFCVGYGDRTRMTLEPLASPLFPFTGRQDPVGATDSAACRPQEAHTSALRRPSLPR
jgi:hypothetical protein